MKVRRIFQFSVLALLISIFSSCEEGKGIRDGIYVSNDAIFNALKVNTQNQTIEIFMIERFEPTATEAEIMVLHNFQHSRSAKFDITPNGIRLKNIQSDFAPHSPKGEIECRVVDHSILIECSKLLREFLATDRYCQEEMIQFSLK